MPCRAGLAARKEQQGSNSYVAASPGDVAGSAGRNFWSVYYAIPSPLNSKVDEINSVL